MRPDFTAVKYGLTGEAFQDATAARLVAIGELFALRLSNCGATEDWAVDTVEAVFTAGDIDFRMFATVVFRTDLITDPEVLAAVDGELAIAAPRWPSMTRGRLAAQVDRIVAREDRDAAVTARR